MGRLEPFAIASNRLHEFLYQNPFILVSTRLLLLEQGSTLAESGPDDFALKLKNLKDLTKSEIGFSLSFPRTMPAAYLCRCGSRTCWTS